MIINFGVFGDVPLYKILRYGIIILVVLFILHYTGIAIDSTHALNQDNVETFIRQAGIFSWLAYLFILVLFVLSPLPSPVLTVIAGYLFNPFLALGLTLLGECLGAMGNFHIGRLLAKGLLNDKKFPIIARLVKRYSYHLDFETILLLGMVPIGTSNVTGYAAGMSGMRFKDYIKPWFLGITVLVLIATWLGQTARNNNPLLTGVIFITVMGALIFMKMFYKKKNKVEETKI